MLRMGFPVDYRPQQLVFWDRASPCSVQTALLASRGSEEGLSHQHAKTPAVICPVSSRFDGCAWKAVAWKVKVVAQSFLLGVTLSVGKSLNKSVHICLRFCGNLCDSCWGFNIGSHFIVTPTLGFLQVMVWHFSHCSLTTHSLFSCVCIHCIMCFSFLKAALIDMLLYGNGLCHLIWSEWSFSFEYPSIWGSKLPFEEDLLLLGRKTFTLHLQIAAWLTFTRQPCLVF